MKLAILAACILGLTTATVQAQHFSPDDGGPPPPRDDRGPPPDFDRPPPRMVCFVEPPPPLPRHSCRTHPGRPGSPCHCGGYPFPGHREPVD